MKGLNMLGVREGNTKASKELVEGCGLRCP